MKKLLLFLLILAFLSAAVFPGSVKANAAAPDRYGYTLLTNDTQRKAYSCLAEGVSALEPAVEFSVPGVTQENVHAVMDDVKFAAQMVYRDHPEYYWYDGGSSIDVKGDVVTVTPNGYKVNGTPVSAGSKEFADAASAFQAALDKAMANIHSGMSDYEIAHTFHDYLIDTVTYELSGDHQSAYGGLVSGKAVCAGYTRTYQLLMNKAGIPCWYISGTSYAPNGELFGHAWNLVWLDGMCYYTDVTWDDQMSELFHEYLNLCKEEISRTHFTNDPLPVDCGHDTYTFFVRNDGKGVCDYHGHRNDAEIAGCFELRHQEGETATYYCTIHYHGDDFNGWFNAHKVGIIKELGLTGSVQCQIIELGLEHHVTLTGKAKTQSRPQPETQPATQAPTEAPTLPPTQAPTEPPTEPPTAVPTQPPTQMPTEPETLAPTQISTEAQTQAPTQPQTQPETQQATEADTSPFETASTAPSETTESASETGTFSQQDAEAETGRDGTAVAIVGGSVAAIGAASGGYLLFLRRRRP